MAVRKTGFGEDPAASGLDLTRGYRDRNPYFDKDFVKTQLAFYKDAGLSQSLGDFKGKDDRQLNDIAAQAVIKLAKKNGIIGGGGNTTTPPATTPPATTPPATTPPATPPPSTTPPSTTPSPGPIVTPPNVPPDENKAPLALAAQAKKMHANGKSVAFIASKLGITKAQVKQYLGISSTKKPPTRSGGSGTAPDYSGKPLPDIY